MDSPLPFSKSVHGSLSRLVSEKLEIKPLPNSKWTKTPAEELRDSLVVKLRKATELHGLAMFSLVFTPTEVESVRCQSGDDQLQSLAPVLKRTHFPMEFPAGSTAKILRRARQLRSGVGLHGRISPAQPGAGRCVLNRERMRVALVSWLSRCGTCTASAYGPADALSKCHPI